MTSPRPTPAQARLLRDIGQRAIRVWGVIIRWADGDLDTYPGNRQTIMACVRLGWMRRLTAQEVIEHKWRNYGDFGGGPGYYSMTPEGEKAIANLPETAFVSVYRARPSVNGLAAMVLRGLASRHPSPEWVFLVEPTIRGEDFAARVDAFALNCFPSENFRRVGYEVKVSRSDFLTEMKHPEKTARAAFFCTSFYFACPADLLRPSDIPDPYGLVIVKPSGSTRMVKRSKLPDRPPTWGTVASLLRREIEESAGPEQTGTANG